MSLLPSERFDLEQEYQELQRIAKEERILTREEQNRLDKILLILLDDIDG